MAARLTIGEFATMTRLSRKALRHYHELGLLEPAAVDPDSGYRYYDTSQVEVARLIRRFRELDMPVPDLKAYVAAPSETARSAVVAAHLARMEDQLAQTRDAVAALRSLLEPAPVAIEVRDLAPVTAMTIAAIVPFAGLIDWWLAAARELDAVVRTAGARAAGPLGACYDHALVADEVGAATVWLPVSDQLSDRGRVRGQVIPGGRFAVSVHDGPDALLDRTYAALGRYVAERGIGADGPLREHYLAGVLGDPAPLVTEVCWPVLS